MAVQRKVHRSAEITPKPQDNSVLRRPYLALENWSFRANSKRSGEGGGVENEVKSQLCASLAI